MTRYIGIPIAYTAWVPGHGRVPREFSQGGKEYVGLDRRQRVLVLLTLSRATGRKLKSNGWPFDCQFPRDCILKLEDALVNLTYWMSVTFSLLKWLFCHTIYGMLGVAVLAYLLFRDLRKTFPRFQNPFLSLPSYSWSASAPYPVFPVTSFITRC